MCQLKRRYLSRSKGYFVIQRYIETASVLLLILSFNKRSSQRDISVISSRREGVSAEAERGFVNKIYLKLPLVLHMTLSVIIMFSQEDISANFIFIQRDFSINNIFSQGQYLWQYIILKDGILRYNSFNITFKRGVYFPTHFLGSVQTNWQ